MKHARLKEAIEMTKLIYVLDRELLCELHMYI